MKPTKTKKKPQVLTLPACAGVLIFDMETHRDEYEDAINGWKYRSRIDDIWNEVFRPRHKHGYGNSRINELLEKPECDELMDLLEDLYRGTGD